MNYFELKSKMARLLYRGVTQVFYRFFFEKIGKKSKIIKPLSLKNTKYIRIGSNVTINEQVFMMTEQWNRVERPRLEIKDGTTIGHFNHIVCCNEVVIERNVLTADKVYISDNCHSYTNIEIPISQQGIYSNGKVRIGEDTWIGENVCIICACIGKHCVVGANSVVTHDVPDYSVVVGSPARIIKRYNVEKEEWQKYAE